MSINEQAAQLGALTESLPFGVLDAFGNNTEGIATLAQAEEAITSVSEQAAAILGSGSHLEEIRAWLKSAKDTVEHARQYADIAAEDARDAVRLLASAGEHITAAAQHHAS
ncbi:hypothetical protein ACWEOE_34060 [Amycolatopsis sp. NPDC004368]